MIVRSSSSSGSRPNPRVPSGQVKISAMNIRYDKYPDADGQPAARVGVQVSDENGQFCRDVSAVVEAFNGEVTWGRVQADSDHCRYDVVFRVRNDEHGKDAAEAMPRMFVGFPEPSTGQVTQWLTVSATGIDAPFAPLLHTILAPAFAPGLVCVDWEDIRELLRRGSHGILAVARGEPQDALPEIRERLAQELDALGGGDIAGAMAALFVPNAHLTMDDVKAAILTVRDLVGPKGGIVGAPFIAEAEPMCALLAVRGKE